MITAGRSALLVDQRLHVLDMKAMRYCWTLNELNGQLEP